MSRITYNADGLKIMSLFEKVTKTRVKDYFIDDNGLTTFVVDEVDIGKAVGKQAINVKKLESLLKKKVKIVGFNSVVVKFVRNLVYPLKLEIEENDGVINLKAQDTKTKGFLIGRNQANLKNNLKIIQKYFKNIEKLEVK